MRDFYVEVTTKILNELEAGTLPWRQPWSATPGRNQPCNGATNRLYNGTNTVLLWMVMHSRDWPTARFVTFRQALELGGHVRKGEHGYRICFFGNQTKAEDSEVGDESGEPPNVRSFRFLKTYVVFNVAQCEGLPARITEPPLVPLRHHDGRDSLIEEFIATTGAKVQKNGSRAAFIASNDEIVMSEYTSFESASSNYGTLFHELGHWTGHKSRLDRDLENRFGSQAHAAEELIAELAAALLCAEFSIDGDFRLPGYIGHYIKLLKADAKAFFTCASKAQAAVDYLRELALREPAVAAE